MDKCKIEEKIRNLLKLSANNPSEIEAKAALLKAQELMLKYHIENPDSNREDSHVYEISYDLGVVPKNEFHLMLSVIIASNFRCKTAHQNSRIIFFGFKEDATAAQSCYGFIINFAKACEESYFSGVKDIEEQNNWRNGFVYGLYIAFGSRAGFELMVSVPNAVMDRYNYVTARYKVTDNK